MALPAERLMPSWHQGTTIAQGFAFTTDNIATFVDNVANHAADICEAAGNVGSAIDLARAAQDVFFALDANTRNPPSSSVLYPKTDLNDQRLLFDYNGIRVRSTTLYDTLAYVLSVTGTLPQERADSVRAYFLPLTALYANWCFKIAEKFKDSRGQFMYHIAYFQTAARPSRKIFLGSTIGSNPSLRTDIKDTRAATLTQLGYQQPVPVGGNQNFGGCAETSFFMYAKQAEPPENSAGGFALDLTSLKPADRLTYNEATIAACLRNPCQQSCQNLFRQIGWRGNPTFQVNTLKQQLQAPSQPTAPRAAPTGGPASAAHVVAPMVQHVATTLLSSAISPKHVPK